MRTSRFTAAVLLCSLALAATAAAKSPNSLNMGLTWRQVLTNAPTGTIHVGCGHTNGSNECNPISGDTPCSTVLPILCIRKTGPGFPLAAPRSIDNTNIYHQWSGGLVATTTPTAAPSTLADANTFCAKELGSDFRVAEFHDGWGWYFQAFGGVANPSQRFWVHINDQPNGTCWQ